MTSHRSPVKRRLRRLFDDRRAATAVEYGLILALIVLTIVGALSSFGSSTRGMWGFVANSVINAH